MIAAYRPCRIPDAEQSWREIYHTSGATSKPEQMILVKRELTWSKTRLASVICALTQSKAAHFDLPYAISSR